MKLLITLVFSLIASPVFAGTPEQDFTVDLTRESFIDGTLPAEKDLYLNFQWVCGTYRTDYGIMTGTAGITLGEVGFIKKDGDLYNRSAYYPAEKPLLPNEKELFSTVTGGQSGLIYHYAIRKNHGGLLIERAADLGNSSPLVESIAFPGLEALAYSYCLPFNSQTKAPKVMNVPWGDVWSN